MAIEGAAAVDTTDVVGRRIGALFIDGLIFFAIFFVVGIASGGGHSGGGQAAVKLNGGATLLFLGITFVYFIVCEGATGQTLGKRLLGIRVVSEDGSRATWGQVVGRTLLRIIDALPVFYIVGLISVLATGRERRQRVGDLAARTRVVPA